MVLLGGDAVLMDSTECAYLNRPTCIGSSLVEDQQNRSSCQNFACCDVFEQLAWADPDFLRSKQYKLTGIRLLKATVCPLQGLPFTVALSQMEERQHDQQSLAEEARL